MISILCLIERLDSMPAGDPAIVTGADIRMLKQGYPPRRAEIALHTP